MTPPPVEVCVWFDKPQPSKERSPHVTLKNEDRLKLGKECLNKLGVLLIEPQNTILTPDPLIKK